MPVGGEGGRATSFPWELGIFLLVQPLEVLLENTLLGLCPKLGGVLFSFFFLLFFYYFFF